MIVIAVAMTGLNASAVYVYRAQAEVKALFPIRGKNLSSTEAMHNPPRGSAADLRAEPTFAKLTRP